MPSSGPPVASGSTTAYTQPSPSLRYRSNHNTPQLDGSGYIPQGGMGVGALSPSLFDVTPSFGREDGPSRSLPHVRQLSGDTIRPSPNLEAGIHTVLPEIAEAEQGTTVPGSLPTYAESTRSSDGYLRKALEALQHHLKRGISKSAKQPQTRTPLPLPGSRAPAIESSNSLGSILSSITYNPTTNQGVGLLKPPASVISSKHPPTITIVRSGTRPVHFPSHLISPPLMSKNDSAGKESLFAKIRHFRETTSAAFGSTSGSPVLTEYEPPIRTRNRTSSDRFSTVVAEPHTRPGSICSDPRVGRGAGAGQLSLFTSLRFASKFPDARSRSRSLRSTTTSLPSYKGASAPTPVLDFTEKGAAGGAAGVEEHAERWSGFKWAMMMSVSSVMVYSLLGLIVSLLYWFRALQNADVVQVADPDVLRYLTAASAVCLLTGLTGVTGTILNSRKILAIYNLMLWPGLACVLVIGYVAYKRLSLNLDLKLNQAWSQVYDPTARLRLQEALRCCGYYNPLHEATFSSQCYPRVRLSGCKAKLLRYERESLARFTSAAFWVAAIQMANIVIGLLCSNHVNNQFGKNLMPAQYRLKLVDVRANSLKLIGELAPGQRDPATAATLHQHRHARLDANGKEDGRRHSGYAATFDGLGVEADERKGKGRSYWAD
ncbi:hypothetical protein CROQUDRAFT_130378 [Cronartium quercuum f. sp. fusiforme G11]|uniref:Tetraspanin Tsp2 n=1 Tax=Cronartium quercuum f. sp. fusiforme G11 TaxID=708437 RepID=A0A9P6NPI5_9BASI|nr:hypothetical protein CROQUDRAFT_130378 [Cronartium quercuum f. sp. fusiforme G11]